MKNVLSPIYVCFLFVPVVALASSSEAYNAYQESSATGKIVFAVFIALGLIAFIIYAIKNK